MLNALELTGRTDTHIEAVPALACSVHGSVVEPLLAMREAAHADGIDLTVVSGFRDFHRQVAIWNGKYSGERTLLDREGRELDHRQLDSQSLIDAILTWSALPGASRHHWGTDIDVIDRAALPEGYQPQLTRREFAADGVFAHLEDWLVANMGRFGFFRPYTTDRGGVQPEPWHLSYAPVSVPALRALSPEVLADAIATSGMYGRDQVLARLPELYQRYVLAVDAPT